MKMIPLNAVTRERSGTGASRQNRRDGLVPAVLYGLGQDPIHVTLNEKEFGIAIHGAQGEHAIVELKIADQPDQSGPAMIKEVQHHPVRGFVLHADLLRIDLSKKINTVVPTKLEGRSVGVVEGGILEHSTREVEITCLPTAIPDFLAADVTELAVGHSLSVAGLRIPDGVEVLTNPDRVLATVLVPRVTATETPEEEAVEGEVPAEEGAAPAEGEAAPAPEGEQS